MSYCETFQDVVDICRRNNDDPDIGKVVPYAIIQPCLGNKRDYKVILFNRIAQHHWNRASGAAYCSNFQGLYQFEELALAELGRHRPETYTRGLIRVDIMQMPDKELVVNEFEGLEANCFCFARNGHEKEINIQS